MESVGDGVLERPAQFVTHAAAMARTRPFFAGHCLAVAAARAERCAGTQTTDRTRQADDVSRAHRP